MQELPKDVVNIIVDYDYFNGYALRWVTKGLSKLIMPVKRRNKFLQHAAGDNLEAVKWLVARNYVLRKSHLIIAVREAKVDIIDYIQLTVGETKTKDWLPNVKEAAIIAGYLDVIKLFFKPKEYQDRHIELAVCGGHLDVIKYLKPRGNLSDTVSTSEAAGLGNLQCLKYLIKRGYPLDKNVMRIVAEGGSVECYEYLRKHFSDLKSNQSDLIILAARANHLNMVKYLHQQGYKLTNDVILAIANACNLEGLQYLHEHKVKLPKDLIECVARKIDCVKFLRGIGLNVTEKCMKRAVKRGVLDCVMYFYEQGCVLTKSYMEISIRNDHLPIVSYLYENGCPMPNDPCSMALSLEAKAVLIYLHQSGFSLPGNSLDLFCAAPCGFAILCYLYSHGFRDIDPDKLPACFINYKNNFQRLVEYLHINGHVFDQCWLVKALQYERTDVLDYILSLGYITPSLETLQELIHMCNEQTFSILLKHKCSFDPEITAQVLIKGKWNIFELLIAAGVWNEHTLITVLKTDNYSALKLLISYGLVIDESIILLLSKYAGPRHRCREYIRTKYPYIYTVPPKVTFRNGKVYDAIAKRKQIKRTTKSALSSSEEAPVKKGTLRARSKRVVSLSSSSSSLSEQESNQRYRKQLKSASSSSSDNEVRPIHRGVHQLLDSSESE